MKEATCESWGEWREQNSSSAWQNATTHNCIIRKHNLTNPFFQICEYIYNNKSIVTKEVKPKIDIPIGDYIIHWGYFRMSQMCSHLIQKHNLLAGILIVSNVAHLNQEVGQYRLWWLKCLPFLNNKWDNFLHSNRNFLIFLN